jgi:hypothetical protein
MEQDRKGEVQLVYRVADALLWIGVTFAGLGPLVILIEIVEWVVTGQWPGWSVEDGLLFIGLEEPLGRFSMTQFILDIATDLPLALGLYLGGLAIFFTALEIEPIPKAR